MANISSKYLIKCNGIGKFYIENGITNFPEWCNIMIDESGKTIEPYLKDIWEKILQDHKELLPDILAAQFHNNKYIDCFCPSCIEESSFESMGNLRTVNFIGMGMYNVGHECKICNSFIGYKSYMIFLPWKLNGSYRVKFVGTPSEILGIKTKFISRKIKDQTKYKFNIFHL